jgi:hypothetical protein
MAEPNTITLTGGTRLDLLGPIEGPVNELRTRLEFLTEFFAQKDAAATMGSEMLYLQLADCLDEAHAAYVAWEAAWVATGGLPDGGVPA